jgi:Holliday junction resolvase-like predicted endonuclease
MEANMEIVKSSRHSKIIGNFGENLICNWLSRSGFELAIVDHTGIDLVAYNPLTDQRLGITVKSRTRTVRMEEESVNVFLNKKDDRQKMLDACKAFASEPWIGIYVEATDSAEVYLTSLKNYDQKYRGKEGKAIDVWKMKAKHKTAYEEDACVKHIRMDFCCTNWTWDK